MNLTSSLLFILVSIFGSQAFAAVHDSIEVPVTFGQNQTIKAEANGVVFSFTMKVISPYQLFPIVSLVTSQDKEGCSLRDLNFTSYKRNDGIDSEWNFSLSMVAFPDFIEGGCKVKFIDPSNMMLQTIITVTKP